MKYTNYKDFFCDEYEENMNDINLNELIESSRMEKHQDVEQRLFSEGAKEVYTDEARIYYALQRYSDASVPDYDKETELAYLIKHNIIKDYIKAKSTLHIFRKDGSVLKFKPMTKAIPALGAMFPELDYIEGRSGCCHGGSINLAIAMTEACKIKTAPVHLATDNKKCYHSWIDMGDYVLDFTMNGVINKEGYEKLYHSEAPISEIPNKKIKEDIEYLADETVADYFFRDRITKSKNNHFLKFYLMTNGMISYDLDRNSFLYENPGM